MQTERWITTTGLILLLGAGSSFTVCAAPMTEVDTTVSRPETSKPVMPPPPPGPYRPVVPASSAILSSSPATPVLNARAGMMPPPPPGPELAHPAAASDWQVPPPPVAQSRWQSGGGHAQPPSASTAPGWQGAVPPTRPLPVVPQAYARQPMNPPAYGPGHDPRYRPPVPAQNGQDQAARGWGYAPPLAPSPSYPQGQGLQPPSQGNGYWQGMPPRPNRQGYGGTAPRPAPPAYGPPPGYGQQGGYGYPPPQRPYYPPQSGYGQRPY